MGFPLQDLPDKASAIKSLLADAQAALDMLSHVAGQADRDSRVDAEQLQVAVTQVRAALEQACKCLDDEQTRRLEVESALHVSEDRVHAFTGSFPVAVRISGKDGVPRFINKAYERLLGYTNDEYLKLKAEDMYWDPQDRQKVLSSLQKDRGVQEFEVQLKRKDGKPIWVLLSAVLAEFDGEQALIGSFQDITVRKQLEAAQRESQQVYSAIFKKSPYALALSKMPSAKLVDVNDAFLTLFGFDRDEVMGKSGSDLHITDPDSQSQVAILLEQQGFVKDYECTRWTRSGEMLWISLSVDWVTFTGEKYLLTTIRDITAYKHTQQALDKTHAAVNEERVRMQAVMEALPVGVAILDEHGGNIQANQAFDLVWGEHRPQIAGVSDYDSYKAWWVDSGQPVQPGEWASAQAVQQGKTVVGQVMKIQKFDGRFAFVHNSAAPIRDQQGCIVGCVVVIQDITQMKSDEKEINQLNRTLKALSSSNQAMLRAASEHDYLEEVCRIITEDCGFAMTWIGFAENDRHKSVRPVASAGFDQGYIDQLKITWADTERGRGPTGTAIRTKKPCRCNNMLTDPKFAPWREAAIKRGYSSSIVLPLIANSHAFGALNIYSCEPEGFSNDEESLLLELAGDLAYGITTLRLKADHALAEEAMSQSEKRYRTIVETSGEGVVLFSPEGEYIYVNQQMSDMLGYPVEEMIGKNSLDFAYPGQKQQVDRNRKKLAKGQKLHGEFKFQRKDGTVLWSWYNAAPMFNDQGEHTSNLAMHTDITERKKLEEHLAYLASFPEKNPRPIIEADLKGHINYANPSALKVFPGIKEQKLAHEYLAGWTSMLRALKMEPGGIVVRDVVVGERYFQQSFHYIPSQGLVRIYGMDITEKKLADQALLQAHEELEQRVLRRTQELNIANEQLRAEVHEREKVQTELESSLQELQVIGEELRNNNEMLVDAQKVLDAERQRFQDLFEFAPDAYLVTDFNGQILEVNQYASTLLQIPPHRMIGKPLLVFVERSDHPAFNHILATLFHQRDVLSLELKLIPRQGAPITSAATVTSSRDQTGTVTLRWTLRDITESKRAEEIIRQNSLRNEALSEISQSLAEASLDEVAILKIVSETTARFIGDSCVINLVSADEKQLDPVAWHHTNPEVLAVMDEIFTKYHHSVKEGLSGKVFLSAKPILIPELDENAVKVIPPEIRQYIDKIGITSTLIVPLMIANKTFGTVSLIRNSPGKAYTPDDQAVLEIIAYRTALMIHNARLYRELQTAMLKEIETHDQLVQAEKFAAVGRLLASITHEINNPLQTIKNCLYLSQIDTPPGTQVYDALTMAVAETNRLSNLVAQLREIYRPPTAGLNRPVKIPVLLGEVQSLLAGYLQENHVTWESAPPQADLPDDLVIEGVADQLKQVFLNITLNSLDAMQPNGGTIIVELKLSADESQVGICFRDTGPGLTQEVKDKLFEPFVTTKEKGLGLGLVICYDIIQKHNGSIEVESEPGQGAAFTVWLPAGKELT